MPIELRTITVAELHRQLGELIAQGYSDLPICATDCRARYPFQACTVLDASGNLDALLLYVRPDARFAQREPLPIGWGPERVAGWNQEADQVVATSGAFAGMNR